MTNNGDDCYFYYYSTCTKGDSCPFRHCESAMGSETVCSLWEVGRCYRTVCKFRHMEIQKKRKEIPCYWENQPAGCQKAHCVFYHDKPRPFVPPSKDPNSDEPQQEEPAPVPLPLLAAANPQLSPTHPPVVINPDDDDEDEDDQFSEEGEDGIRLTSPRKLSGDSIPALNFGVSTLEEIRLMKVLKASMNKAGYPVRSPDTPHPKANGASREDLLSHLHPAGFQAREDPICGGETNCVIGRLGKRVLNKVEAKVTGQPPLKRSLAERLGRVVEDEEQTEDHHRNGLKPIKERLGVQEEAPAQPAKSGSSKTPRQIRIKTLEEIRQEKASKFRNKNERIAASAPGTTADVQTLSTKAPKGAKQPIVVKDHAVVEIMTVHAKKRQEEDVQKPDDAPSSPGKASRAAQICAAKARGPAKACAPDQAAPPGADLRVKTLEEIRQEKAARLHAEQAKQTADTRSPGGEEPCTQKPCLLRISKPQVPSTVDSSQPPSGIPTRRNTEAPEKPAASTMSSAEVSPASSNSVKVKTFEEIMREKRLRKQELEEQDSSPCPSPGSAEAPLPQKHLFRQTTASLKAKNLSPATTSPCSSSDGLAPTQSPPVRNKRFSLRSKVDSPSARITSTVHLASPSSSPPQPAPADSGSQSPKDAVTAQGANSCSTQVKQTKRMASQETSPRQTTEIKVRPKLNVKPSVINPAAQIKPGQKRKLAVKPLNSTSTVAEDPLCKQQAISPTTEDVQPSPAATQSPASLLASGPGTSPAKQNPHTVPVVRHGPGQNLPNIMKSHDAPASREACPVPQSPTVKAALPAKLRRSSVAASRPSNSSSVSALDDFDELMNEFTDDHLGEDMDPGMGEDDLLQELSEMIDS